MMMTTTMLHRPWPIFMRGLTTTTIVAPAKSPSTTIVTPSKPSSTSSTLESVQEYYGKLLSSSKDLKTSACTASGAPSKSIREIIASIPSEVTDKFYGCGTPLPESGLEGLNVLDLGCGSGRDCMIAAKLVGPKGTVTGIDMTEEQLDVAKKGAKKFNEQVLKYTKSNMVFKKGYIEKIASAGVKNESQDLVISNCVINLSPDKPAVFKGMFDALKWGGEAYFSDVYCDRRLPDKVKQNKVLWGECLAGALYVQDFLRECRKVGFVDPRVLEQSPIEIQDEELHDILGNAKFYSITYRLFKIKNLESLCEDYGQVATYRGTLPNNKHAYVLDDHHVFETGRPMLVCGNTASMVGETRLKSHFHVSGDRSTHFGLFDCGPDSSNILFENDHADDASCCVPPSGVGGGGGGGGGGGCC